MSAANKLKSCSHVIWLPYVAENSEVCEAIQFFAQHHLDVYYLFHEGFTNVEASLAQRRNAFLIHSDTNFVDVL